MAKTAKLMEIGTKCFYPPHGVVSLTAVEDREFAGTNTEFHVLELVRGGTLLVPSKSMASTSFRPLISAKKAKELQKRMRSKAKSKINPGLDGKERTAKLEGLLKEGDADDYAEILRELMVRAAEGRITLNEQKLMDTARAYFVDEIGSVLKIDANQFLVDVAKALAPPKPEPGTTEDGEEEDEEE